ncbi:MAG: hypothetical protein KDK04_17695 [Candidatus Competibacteraceae bacterium]|nr:hypothetical protein [Candidatus Competibacteraceae bacterium]
MRLLQERQDRFYSGLLRCDADLIEVSLDETGNETNLSKTERALDKKNHLFPIGL